MRYRVLGPLEVIDDGGRDVTPTGPLQRRLLAGLLLYAGRVVSVDRLADLLSPSDAPADLAAALQTHVFRLRRSLPDVVVTRQPPGYRLEASPDEIDALGFAAAVGKAAARRTHDPTLVSGPPRGGPRLVARGSLRGVG